MALVRCNSNIEVCISVCPLYVIALIILIDRISCRVKYVRQKRFVLFLDT